MKYSKHKSVSFTNARQYQRQSDLESDNTKKKKKRSEFKVKSNLMAELQPDKDDVLSRTQTKIRSHSLVNNILSNCRLKVVDHHVQPFNKKMQLYKKYSHQKVKTEGYFDLKEEIFNKSSYNIEKVFTEITDKTPTIVKMKKSIMQNLKTQGAELGQQEDAKSKQISMSGLISYNFKSVKSKNRLAFASQQADKQMFQEIEETKKRTRVIIQRDNKIHHKTDPSDTTKADLNQAIAENYGNISTQQYLQAFVQEKQKHAVIFGKDTKELESLKKLSKEVDQIDEAFFMIEKIKEISKDLTMNFAKKKKVQKRQLTIDKQQKEFNTRIRPQNKTKIKVSAFLNKDI